VSKLSGVLQSSRRWPAQFLASPKDRPAKTLVVAAVVSFCCAVLVAGTAIWLRPKFQDNQELNRQRNILAAAGLLMPNKSVAESFEQVESRVVDLQTGEYARDVDPERVVNARAAANRLDSTPIPRDLDIAFIRERPRYAVVYLVYEAGRLDAIVLPVYGYGMWSTLYGYIALQADANTIMGLRFYAHAETPGLGARIDNPEWQRLWRGKKIYGDSGEPLIEVVKGQVLPGTDPRAIHRVDGITGATLTGGGVTNLLRYWLGEQGFGSYLQRAQTNGDEGL